MSRLYQSVRQTSLFPAFTPAITTVSGALGDQGIEICTDETAVTGLIEDLAPTEIVGTLPSAGFEIAGDLTGVAGVVPLLLTPIGHRTLTLTPV